MTYHKDILSQGMQDDIRAIVRENSLDAKDTVLFDVLAYVARSLPLSEDVVKAVAWFVGVPEVLLWKKVAASPIFMQAIDDCLTIQVCGDALCCMRGGQNLLQCARRVAKESVIPVRACTVQCLGACAQAPVMRINGQDYGSMSEESLKKIIKGEDRNAQER